MALGEHEGAKWVEIDLALLVQLLRLADAAQAWRTADTVPACEGARGRVFKQIGRLMGMCPTAAEPMIRGMSPEEIRAVVDSSDAAERGLVH